MKIHSSSENKEKVYGKIYMFEELKELIIVGDEDKAKTLTQKFLSMGKNADEIMKGGLVVGMDVVGQRFKEYEMYLPEVKMSATAMKASKEKISGVKVMVGGSPLTQEFADKVGADGFAPDALRAINLAKKLAGKQ